MNLTIVTPPTNFIVDGLKYVVTSPTTVSVGDNNGVSGSISIPATVSSSCGTYSVTNISEYAFINNTVLTSVAIPASVSSISNYAFYGCSG